MNTAIQSSNQTRSDVIQNRTPVLALLCWGFSISGFSILRSSAAILLSAFFALSLLTGCEAEKTSSPSLLVTAIYPDIWKIPACLPPEDSLPNDAGTEGNTDPNSECSFSPFQELYVQFSEPLDPNSINSSNIVVYSGSQRLYSKTEYAPELLAIRISPSSSEGWPEGVWINLAMRSDSTEGLRKFDGTPLKRVVESTSKRSNRLQLPIGSAKKFLAIPPSTWTNTHVSCADALQIFGKYCTDCHNSERSEWGLDLSSADALSKTAIGIPSKATQKNGSPKTHVSNTDRFGYPMSIISSGNAAQSYLLYKLYLSDAIRRDTQSCEAMLAPNLSCPSPSEAQKSALADYFVGGAAMPNAGPSPTATEVRRLAQWFDQGASLVDCSTPTP